MALILSIDTAMENAGVCLAQDGNVIAESNNSKQMDHAAWIHNAIKELLQQSARKIEDVNAVAVTEGPGSYTGLRVGMATAKGLCFALNIPLITENTLELLAITVKESLKSVYTFPVFYCPMIDARRMEVFTALYDPELQQVIPPSAVILDDNSFKNELEQHHIVFCGNGSIKWQNICKHSNAVYSGAGYSIADLGRVAEQKYIGQEFADIAYTEPLYVKNVYTGLK